MDLNGLKVTKVKLNSKGVRALLQSEEVRQELLRQGRQMGEVESSYVGFDRVHVVVKEPGND